VALGTAGDSVEITVSRTPAAGSGEEEGARLEIEEKSFQAYVRAAFGDRLVPDWLRQMPRPFEAPADADERLKAVDGGLVTVVSLLDPVGAVTPERLEQGLAEELPYWVMRGSERDRRPASSVTRTVVVRPTEDPQGKVKTFRIWLRSVAKGGDAQVETSPPELRAALSEFLGGKGLKSSLRRQGVAEAEAEEVGLSTPFPSVDAIGTSVARRLQNDAIIALVLSLLGIIVYVAFRFSSRDMGLAAVTCLFHDVVVTLGVAIVCTGLGLVDAKISLTTVAAYLTLVGFSVNDTVVVFDRIRENRGKKTAITPAMIDLSINQTFARTIKTSFTVLLSTIALFVVNYRQRNVLEGFSFIFIVGAFVGVYSTVAIAAPLLLFLPWHAEHLRPFRPRAALVTEPASRVLLLPLLPVAAVLWVAWALAYLVLALVAGVLLFPFWALTVRVEGEGAGAAAA